MINEKYSELVIAWLDQQLDVEQQKQLDTLISDGIISLAELENLRRMESELMSLPDKKPSEEMHLNFYRWLNRQVGADRVTFKEKFSKFRSIWQQVSVKRMAWTLMILIVGFSAGMFYQTDALRTREIKNLNNEIASMKSMMVLTLLNQSSSFERLKAVSMSSEIDNSDGQIVDALFKTLNNDPNVNVRLAALEVLARRGHNPQVRKRLVQSIDQQESPIIQVALADIMLSLDDKNSVKKFQELLKNRNLNQTVRSHLKQTIAKLL